eukprot:g10429.t1
MPYRLLSQASKANQREEVPVRCFSSCISPCYGFVFDDHIFILFEWLLNTSRRYASSATSAFVLPRVLSVVLMSTNHKTLCFQAFQILFQTDSFGVRAQKLAFDYVKTKRHFTNCHSCRQIFRHDRELKL